MSRRPALAMPSTVSAEPDEVDELKAGDRDELPAAAGDAGVVASLTGADVSSPLSVDHLPTPYDVSENVARPLNEQERQHLAVCEQALRGLGKALIVAGKALEVINRGRLYRETHATFADYVFEAWGMRRAHAYRLIEGWPVAAALSPIGDINEAQARELLPVYKEHGQETTEVLYREARELSGGKVTAAALAEARAVLPPRRQLADPDQVRDVLRVAAAEGRVPRLTPPPQVPQQQTAPPAGESQDPGRTEVQEGLEAVAQLEAAVAQQRQVYDSLAGTVPLALTYDPGRADLLLRELRQYANRTAYRARPHRAGDQDEDS